MLITRRLLTAGASALAAAGCSPLAIFDAVAPRDSGTTKPGRALAYGPHPRQTLDVHVPSSPGSAAAPVVVFFYGGSWKGGTKEEYDFVGAALAAQGFVAVLPDYRVYPEVRFPDFLEDSAAAVGFAQQNAARFGGDGSRIILAGHSAGAYNAAMLAYDGRYLGRAGVPAGTVRGFAGLSGPYDFLPLDPGTAQEVFGDAPDKRATQPITFAGRGSPPSFLASGTADDTVRPKNTVNLAAKLRAAGVPVVERLYEGLDHKDTLISLSVPFRGSAPALAEMSSFVRSLGAGRGRVG
ncbi:alpha/beta hydrolase [uncultured Enterovirga sp.]|uniref:alpha/beta hydrolase n=1 Tax=uncultured Enterovirga sp. TaxID=2026352 RepID=UPI0035CB1E58